MSVIDNAGQKMAGMVYAGDDKKQFDPFTIAMLIGLIVNIISVIQKCVEANKVSSKATKKGMIDNMVLRRIVKKHVGKEQWKAEGNKIMESLYKVGSESTTEEITEAYQDARVQLATLPEDKS